MNKETLKTILQLAVPYILELIKSKVVPALKRKAYEKLDDKANKIISDLVQNASKINKETDEAKKSAYIEGTKLGLETIKAIAEKLNQAAAEIEKVL